MRRNPGQRNRSKHQHWVPQFYLRYFATTESRNSEQPQVWIFSKDPADGSETLTNVRNVCGKRFLYTPVQSDGQRSWDLDERLEELESTLGKVWPALAEGYISLDDANLRSGLALFVSVMHLRNPEVREEVERIHRSLTELYESAPRLPDGTPAVEAVEINGRVHNVNLDGWQDYRSWGKNEHDRFFAHVVQTEAIHIAKMLLLKRWSVVCSEEDTFITTDKPVAVHHHSLPTVGFGTPGAVVTFPLSPRRLLVMDDMHSDPANQYYPLKESNAGPFNLTTWRNGSRFMITGRPIPNVLNELNTLNGAPENGA